MALAAISKDSEFLQVNRVFKTLVCLALGVLSVESAADRPNVLWITAEDMSPQLGCYGDAYADTPRIDRLAADGIRYENFFAESPMCSPSRATIITGMHNGPLGASQMRSNHRVPEFVRPFSAWLRDVGYYCTNSVKTDYNLARDASGDEQSFTAAAWDETSVTAHWRDRPPGKPFFCVLNYMDTHQSRSSRDDYLSFQKNVQSRLEERRIHDPDTVPLPPHYPDSPVARRTMARYYDCISTLDDFVGQTLDDLQADGIAEDTIVFFYSDHGAGLPTGKGCATDFGLRCPLIVHVPQKWKHLAPGPPGTTSDRLVCFADLAPTVLRLAGIRVPRHMHGRPFLGANPPEPPAYVTGTRDRMDETLETTRWITDGRYLFVRAYRQDVPFDQQTLTSWYNSHGELCQEIRRLKAADSLSETQLHFWSDRRAPVQLFDTVEDRWCLRDLSNAPEHRSRAKKMERELEDFMLSRRDLGFWPEPELADAEQRASGYESARTSDGYPLERILQTAKMTDVAALRDRLFDRSAAVRYWAIVGIANSNADIDLTSDAWRALLQDPAASVRIEAAFQTAKRTESPAALDALATELDSDNQWAACRAARALELLGERAGSKVAKMRLALNERTYGFFHQPQGSRPVHLGLEFSLLTALENLAAGQKTDEESRRSGVLTAP